MHAVPQRGGPAESRAPVHGDVLTAEDYRLLVRVLETVDQAPDLVTFKRELGRALRRWFGYRAVAVTHGSSLDGAAAHEETVYVEGYSQRFLDEYKARWVAADPLRDQRVHRLLAERGVVAVHDLGSMATAAQRTFIDEFLRPNGITSKFGVRVDCEPIGSLYLAVVPDDERAPNQASALLRALRRHLTPIARRLLADDQAPTRQPPWHLTARERQVAALVADGLTNQQIAERLVIGVDTVKKHLTRVLTETECIGRTQLAIRWHQRSTFTIRPRQLPPGVGRFTGRTHELAALDVLLAARDRDEPAVAVLEGMAGMGKTALAVHWANRWRDAFDLDLFLDLKGCTDPVTPAEALGTVLHSLGVPDEVIPPELEQRSALLRSTLTERGRPLLVLDDAADAEQVRPLLPGNGAVVLVTSRVRLRGLVARDGAIRVPLCEYSERDALELLAAMAGRARVDAEPGAANELVDLCGRLPLAIALAAERAAQDDHLPLATQARELADAPNRLRVLSQPNDPSTDLSAALSSSARVLGPPAARVFRLLGLHPGTEFGSESVAALCDVPLDEAVTALDALVGAHLLTQSGRGRFRLPGLVGDYARNLADEQGSDATAVERLVDWYVKGAGRATFGVIRSDARRERFALLDDTDARLPRITAAREGHEWFERERDALLGATRQAIARQWHDRVWRLSHLLFDLFVSTFDVDNWLLVGEAGMRSAQCLGETDAILHAAGSMGAGYMLARRWDDALEVFQTALARCTADGDDDGAAWMLGGVGRIHAHRGDHISAVDYLERALARQPRDDRFGVATLLADLARSRAQLGDHAQAVETAATALATSEHELGQGITHFNLAEVYLTAGDVPEAESSAATAVTFLREAGRPHRLVDALTSHGRILRRLKRAGDAVVAWEEALDIAERFHLPGTERIRVLHEQTRRT